MEALDLYDQLKVHEGKTIKSVSYDQDIFVTFTDGTKTVIRRANCNTCDGFIADGGDEA